MTDMYAVVKAGLKQWGEYLRLPPIGRDQCAGFPSKSPIADMGRRRAKSKQEELDDYNKYYKPKHHHGVKVCPECGANMNGTACSSPNCTYEDDSTLFKTYAPVTGKETRQATLRSAPPSKTVQRYCVIMDELKADPQTLYLYRLAFLKFKEELGNEILCLELECSETALRDMQKQLYLAVYLGLRDVLKEAG